MNVIPRSPTGITNLNSDPKKPANALALVEEVSDQWTTSTLTHEVAERVDETLAVRASSHSTRETKISQPQMNDMKC